MKCAILLSLVLVTALCVATFGEKGPHPRSADSEKWRAIQQTSNREIRGFLNQKQGRVRQDKRGRGGGRHTTGDFDHEEIFVSY